MNANAPSTTPSTPLKKPMSKVAKGGLIFVGLIVLFMAIPAIFGDFSSIKRTLTELRAERVELRGPWNEEKVNDSGDTVYRWDYSKHKGLSVYVIMRKDGEVIREIRSIVANDPGNVEGTMAGFAFTGVLINFAANDPANFDFQGVSKWLVENAAKKGAVTKFGKVTVSVKDVAISGKVVSTLFNIY